MENATKALLIASGVLVGVLILSLAVYLYTTLGEYVDDTQKQMEINSNNQFNTQFLKYINMTEDSHYGTYIINSKKYVMDFNIRLQDIITIASLAHENNRELDLQQGQVANANKNNLYVQVNVKINGTTQRQNLETNINNESASILSADNGYLYRCTREDIKISEKTGRVYEINFH